ncbi:MAG: sodium:calcium antiporter [Gammaproteobacteria bacterium]|nr:sodium:calcium antiporter [Gammaproteobacteria bacterium]
MDVLILIVSLIVILAGSELFTNALEHLGDRFGLSTGVTGSILAAVGTALPEAVVPIVAIASGGAGGHHTGEAIGVGAILGAPLMLSTLAFFLIGVMALARRGVRGAIAPERTGFHRDLHYFIVAFVLAIGALYVPVEWGRILIAIVLILIYPLYIWRTIRASKKMVESGHETEASGKLYAAFVRLPNNPAVMSLQLLVALALIIGGAHAFVGGVTAISVELGISPLFLALAIVPFATEMPEKMNSLIWIFRRKDTLAVGNITGAMVFQSSLLPAIGILGTSWQSSFDVDLAMGITLAAGLWLIALSRLKKLPALALMLNGAAYAIYFILLLTLGI